MPEEQPQDPPAPPPAPEHGAPLHHHARPELPSFRFFDELKRRNVGRVAILYIVVGYVALEVFEVFFHLLEMPAWAGRVAVLVMVVGFPVVLIFAWAYEITPEGLKPTEEVSPKHSTRQQTGKRLDRAIIAVLAIALTYFVVDKFWLSKHSVPATALTTPEVRAAPAVAAAPEKSVAVLPFLDMSEKHDQEYFSDGLSEELIDMLTKVPDLRVPARTSSFFFKGKQTTIADISKALGVAHVLEGSVRKSGKTLRITAQLIRVDNGYHLWSETFDRKLDDIFKVQDEIAGEVVKALEVSLSASAAPLASRTSDTDAYLLYLKGSALFRNVNEADSAASVTTLKESLKLDPSYAPAWAMLGRAIAVDYRIRGGDYARASAGTRAAAEQAIKLDPRLPDAYIALALADFIDWRWDAGDAEINKALALQPESPLALKFASFVPLYRGQTDAALRYAEAALVRDPLDALIYNSIEDIQDAAGRYSLAEAAARKSQELNPAQGSFHSDFAYYQFMNGNPTAALTEIRQEPDEWARLIGQVIYLDALGRRAEADADLAVFLKKYAATSPFSMAGIYALRGKKDLAFGWLERAYRQHDYGLRSVKINQELRSLRTDPRFNSLLRKVNLLE